MTTSFHPTVQAWLARRFGGPTAAQAQAWPLIMAGHDVLITAPTGSGKTLASFLACLDALIREAIAGTLEDRTRVLYVSPLKALSNDIRVNLDEPLAEIAALAEEMGYPRPAVRTAVRTGDTTARERRQAAKHPPHVLVTTPESLYILLTSESGRRALSDVRTVIVDEIHAVARDKRGAHLALSLERLDALCTKSPPKSPPTEGTTEATTPRTLQRIGLSATVNPIEVAGRLLCGSTRPQPLRVEVSPRRDLDLGIELPKDELGAVCTNEQWGEIYDRITTLIETHRSTLVFVNTRRLVERVAHRLGERLGESQVAAHHGSLSRERRHKAEKRLKAGDLRVVVATASLELGIDVGAVDLVCLVGSPRSISTGLQRIGRSGHVVGGTPKGRLFPLTRDQLIETVALVRAARRGVIDAVALRDAPLDVLGQQIVAACACEEWDEDALFELCRSAAPYAALERKDFDAIVDMLSEGIATSRGRAGALLHRDAVNRKLKGRRGARLGALTSGGAIPDNANYDVVLEPEGTLVGNIDEDFAVESMAGDIILLGNNSWRIRRVEAGRVRVEDAAGAPPTIPFWLGEGPARTRELSAEVGAVRVGVLDDDAPPAEGEPPRTDVLDDAAFDEPVKRLVRDYLRAGAAALGGVPSERLVIAERFFDEAGGMQLVVHAPFGGRINRAWGTALRKRFCRSFDFELQAAATDDGLVLSLGAQHSFPLETVFQMLRPEDIDELLTQASVQAPMFETRWRWNAMRSLALLRHRGGKRVPPQIQRMRAQDLIAAVFPGQTACQDNHGGGAIEIPDHPLVHETIRDCLTEAMDAEGLRAVLTDLRAGRIKTLTRELPEPSVFAHEILNSNPYTFLDDAPLEERRTRAVTLRRGLPAEVVERLGALDPQHIDEVVAEAQPDPRNADELHDLLLDLGALAETVVHERGWTAFADALSDGKRAAWLHGPTDDEPRVEPFLVAAERRTLAETIWPQWRLVPDIVEPPLRRPRAWSERDGALAELVRGHLTLVGPTTAARLAEALALPPSDIEGALARVELEGNVLRGSFDPRLHATKQPADEPVLQWCDRRLLARINRRTLDNLRREIQPASAADYMRFLLAWQHVAPGTQVAGQAGLLRVIEQLQGFEAAAGAWERDLLPARVQRYEPAWLDGLCLAGDVTWGRLAAREAAATPNRTATIALVRRRDLAWLLTPREGMDDGQLSVAARDVLTFLREGGASFVDDIVHGARRLRAEVEEALWELVGAGRVTGDGFAGLRALVSATRSRGSTRARWHARWVRRQDSGGAGGVGTGRWAVLRPPATTLDEEEMTEALARQYLRRYGVVIREVLAREPQAPPWRELLRALRRLEMRGELRGGRLVAGFVGEQFATPEALESLRAIRRETENGSARRGDIVRLSACDPLNLAGIITPGERTPATLGHQIVLRDGVPEAPAVDIAPRGRSSAPDLSDDDHASFMPAE
ncbi:MAG TPA: DEAD/DEAH box helicase [Polyangia bacterium]|jgi:ATP-dependent Lhr-like helicase